MKLLARATRTCLARGHDYSWLATLGRNSLRGASANEAAKVRKLMATANRAVRRIWDTLFNPGMV